MRPASDDDLAAISALERAGFPDPWSVEQVAGELRQPSSFLLVAVRGQSAPLGYASFRLVVDEAELLRLVVEPAARRLGVGRRLLEAGFGELARRGAASCFLEVRAGNSPAIALYERFGFTHAGARRAYFRDGEDALIYTRPIAPNNGGPDADGAASASP